MNIYNFLRTITDQRELFQLRKFFIDQLLVNENRDLFIRFCHLRCKFSDRFRRRNFLDFFKNRIRVDDDIRFAFYNFLLSRRHCIEREKKRNRNESLTDNLRV